MYFQFGLTFYKYDSPQFLVKQTNPGIVGWHLLCDVSSLEKKKPFPQSSQKNCKVLWLYRCLLILLGVSNILLQISQTIFGC